MQLSDLPGKISLAFAEDGGRNSIPVASQILVTPGAASYTDGFPPLTRTPISAGGVPPSGLDMNGILYALSITLRWLNAGGGLPYDGTFATDTNVGGYPKGARVLRSDGLGYWLNTVDNNTTDPESSGSAAAGWVPDISSGVTSVTMTNANVTLTALQYNKPIIVISGTLSGNLNLIFPAMVGKWIVINNTLGAYTVTCKTASGTGVVAASAFVAVGDGTNIYAANDGVGVLSLNTMSAGGTADALTATPVPSPRSWFSISGVPFWIRAASANATTTPTLALGSLTAKTIVKGSNAALLAGDISGAGHWIQVQYDSTLDKVVLLNPAFGVTSRGISRFTSNGTFTVPSGITTIYVSGWAGGGGGGAGGGGDSSFYGGGGGGGSAGQSIFRAPYSVTPGASINITIGSAGLGGTGGTSTGPNGTNGGDTIIGSLVTLTKGSGGNGGGNVSSGNPAGGTGGTGYPNGSYGSDGNKTVACGNGGPGASCPFGGGGGSGRAEAGAGSNKSGANAFGYGAGGGGGGGLYSGSTSTNGGNGGKGAPGLVIIEY